MASATSASRSHDVAASADSRPLARPQVEIAAVTTRDDFLLELGQALGGQAAVQPVETLEAALEALRTSRRAQVLVIDGAGVANLRAAVDAAHAAVPAGAIVVCAEAEQLASLGKGGRPAATIALPFDAARARTVLEGAIAAALRGHAAATDAATTAGAGTSRAAAEFAPRAPAPSTAASPAGEGRRPRLALGLALAMLALAAAGAGWYFMHPGAATAPHAPVATPAAAAPPAAPSPDASAQNAPPEVPAETALVQGRVDELLEKARAAMHARHFAEPAGDNALLYYRSAAAADPGSAEARDGLQRIAGVLATRFEEALGANRFDEAAANLASFRLGAPNDPRSAAFEQRLYGAAIPRALADGNPERAAAWLRQAQQSGAIAPEQIAHWRADIARRQDESRASRLAGLVTERIRDGRLVDGEDSARNYLQQLQQAAPGAPATQRAAQDLIAACLHRARDAAIAHNNAEQQHWLDAATRLGATPAELAASERELAGARAKATQAENERLLQLARERLQDGRLTDPAQDCAASYLTQLQAADAQYAGLADARAALAAALLERARTAARSGKPADADLAAARRFGASPTDVAAVQQLAAPAAPAPAADPAALAANLKQLRAPPPDYPQGALARRIAGSVTLSFIVDTRGETRDIRVLEATPSGVFEQAATNAVKHWRYAPMIVNGSAVEVPVRTRIHFELPK